MTAASHPARPAASLFLPRQRPADTPGGPLSCRQSCTAFAVAPTHALRGLDKRRQDRWGRADRSRFAPVLQGTACQAEVGGHLPLGLSHRQARRGRFTLLRPLQARATPYDQPTVDSRAVRRGTGLASELKSIPAGPSNIFLHPRLACASKGTKFRGSCRLSLRTFTKRSTWPWPGTTIKAQRAEPHTHISRHPRNRAGIHGLTS